MLDDAPSRTSKCHTGAYFDSYSGAIRRRRSSSATGTARPSTTTSSPASSVLHPVVSVQSGEPAMFTAFCSSGPVQK